MIPIEAQRGVSSVVGAHGLPMTACAPLSAGGGRSCSVVRSCRLLASPLRPLARKWRHRTTARTELQPVNRASTRRTQNPASSRATANQGSCGTGQLVESKLELAANMFNAPLVASKVTKRGACSTSPHVKSAKCQSRAALVLSFPP